MFVTPAYAQSAGGGGGDLLIQMLPFVMIFAIMYFLIIKPQQNRVKQHREMISNITDIVTDEIELWRNRPVDEVYPIVYVDGIRLKIRDKGAVTIKVAHLVVGVDVEGRKHALGVWIAEAEGAKFWHSVLTQLRNRGLRDVLIACCDGLTGLPEAITSVFPDTVVQTCVVHVIRNCMRFVSYQDRKKITKSMKTNYTAPTVEAAELALKDLDQTWVPSTTA